MDRWIGHVRPCAVLRPDGEGPVAGRFGGPLLLPAEVPDPWHPYVGYVDFAALPKDSTDLPLPPDGRLLLFAGIWELWDGCNRGRAVYVPADAPVAERDSLTWTAYEGNGIDEFREIFDHFPQGELRVAAEPDLPGESPGGFPHGDRLQAVWGDVVRRRRHLQIGGYPANSELQMETIASCAVEEAEQGRWGGGEPVSGAGEDWVMLAFWDADVADREGTEMQWSIQRADLEARRFDRTYVTGYYNP
ncbi:DUF1963 domain-containing protein [Streptomyces sp. NRRL F-5123]|uniref:DUF1963 domain-containing protein n=1 Tax=Streptomyces sp. NRRL F-5123 TaxID=1463856 RepID=UPI0006938ABA|nr:DUF1963 domain-containing protein [Streptomyces sp. NRRL F-5123]